jgi:hypothetical protein
MSSRCLYISGVITLAATMRAGRQRRRHDDEPERPAWQNDHDSASHSAFLGIFSTTAQARARFLASLARQRKPDHIALHGNQDSAGRSTMRGITITTVLEHIAYSQNHDAVVAAQLYAYVDHGRRYHARKRLCSIPDWDKNAAGWTSFRSTRFAIMMGNRYRPRRNDQCHRVIGLLI